MPMEAMQYFIVIMEQGYEFNSLLNVERRENVLLDFPGCTHRCSCQEVARRQRWWQRF